MLTQIENSMMTCTLEAGEILERHVLQAAMTKATDENLWSVFLVLRPEVANAEFDLLSDLGFRMVGNLSLNNQYLYKLKKHLRWSGETGGSSACPTPQLALSAAEVGAIQRFVQEHPAYQGAYDRAVGKTPVIDSGTF